MKSEEEIRKKAIRIFIRKKVKEITTVLITIFGIIGIPYLIGLILFWVTKETGGYWKIWVTGLIILIFFGCMILLTIYVCVCIYILIRDWLKDNWEKSLEEAKRKNESKM